MTPSVISGKENFALEEAKIMSHLVDQLEVEA